MKLMDKFFNDEFPEDIVQPLNVVKHKEGGSHHKSGIFSPYTNIYYYSSNDNENPIFIQWDDNHMFSNEKWNVDPKFSIISDFFGETAFEDYIKWKFGIDITKRGKKFHAWSFY